MNSDKNNFFNDSINNSCDTLEISEEEIFHLSANIIQSVFRGYLLRKILYYRIHLYLNYSWAFNFLNNFLKFKLNKKFLDNLLFNYYFKTNKKNIKNFHSRINYKKPQIFIRKKYVFLSNFISIRKDNFTLYPKKNIFDSIKTFKNPNDVNKEIKTYEYKISELKGNFNNKNKNSENEKINTFYKSQNFSNINNPINLSKKQKQSSSFRNSFNIQKSLKSVIGINKLIKSFKGIVIRKYYEFFIIKYYEKNKNLINLIHFLTSNKNNILSNIIYLIEKIDKIILNLLCKKFKRKLFLYFKNL